MSKRVSWLISYLVKKVKDKNQQSGARIQNVNIVEHIADRKIQ